MQVNSPRWHEISPSEYPHEREGLAHLRELLPDRAPFHAWSNFEFRDRTGKWHEVDALVLGERRLHLVELKHYQGTITGDAYRWKRNGRSEDSPLLAARRKAQRLKSVISDALHALQPGVNTRQLVPFVQESIFLHAANGRCALPTGEATDLFGLDGQQHSGLPSIVERVLEPAPSGTRAGLIDQDDLVVQLFERIGFGRRRAREVGSWRLVGAPLAEGTGWQDWPAEHRLARRERTRIRFFVSEPGAREADRRGVYQLATREYDLTRRLHHDAVLRPSDLVEDELGIGLVYPRDEEFRRLDLWLDDHGQTLALSDRLDIIRKLAEALAYVHRHHVVHRGLAPTAVLVRRHGDALEVQLGDWQIAGADRAGGSPVLTGTSTPGGAASRIFALLENSESTDPERQRSQAYLAPEGRWNLNADRVRLDVFALGAVAYHIVAGRPPAVDGADLRDRVTRDAGLDLVADVPEVPGSLRTLILDATRPVVRKRLSDVQAFLALLDDVDRETVATSADAVTDPLEATPGMLLGQRFELLRRLGSGSTAVGLLVADRHADDERRVLKVALHDSAAARLRGEAEVLASLGTTKHPRLVRLVEPEPLLVGNRSALLLESAGETTLAEVLRERPRLSLDLLERYGTDLLEALVGLDKANVDHRDIKPANLGVREQRGDRAKHLVLFDFSLSRAGASAVDAGTPPYLDPFLGSGTRPTWDSAAERYAAAVTLFEMATGHTPRYGDDDSNPSVITEEATVEPGAFDPSVATVLVDFFRQALRRQAKERHHTAAEMLAAWRTVFATQHTTVPGDAEKAAAAAQPATLLSASGLSARALSALEPLRLNTVGDLAAVDPGRLSRLAGVADSTRKEVRGRAKQWRLRFGTDVGETQPPGIVAPNDDQITDAQQTADVLIKVAHTPARRRVTELLLGLDGDSPAIPDAFAAVVTLAPVLSVGGQPQAWRQLSQLQDSWAADTEARDALDLVLLRADSALASLGGLAEIDTLVQTLTPDGAGTPSVRLIAGLVRLALDRADAAERNGGEPTPIARRRRQGRGQLVATAPALLEVAEALGQRADSLVAAGIEAGEDVVPVGRGAARLRAVWPADLPAPDDVRLVRLAARLSVRAAASRRGELHARDLSPSSAVAIALGGLASSQALTVKDLGDRVRARFPDLPPLPGRPRLDAILSAANVALSWDGERYAVPSRRPDTTLASRVSEVTVELAGGRTPATDEDARLAQSIRSRAFLALVTTPQRLDTAASALVERHGAAVIDVTEVLLRALREEAGRRGVPWNAVQAADAAEAGSRPAQGLAALVRGAMPAVEATIAETAAQTPDGTRPILLVEAAPLARYGHTDLLTRLADLTQRRPQGIWLLMPKESDGGAVLDGVPLQLGHGGQLLRLGESWLRASTTEEKSR